jgi:hypothetical protein
MSQPVIFESFKTLNHLLDTIENRTENDVFRGAGLTSQRRSSSKNDSFFGSAQTFAQAKEMLLGGYPEPLERIKRELVKVDKSAVTPRNQMFTDMVGFAPHVPNTIMGYPKTMINRKPQPMKAKTIHLMYGFSAIGNVRDSELIKGGTMFLQLVNSLELSGYRVKIDIIRCTTTSEKSAIGYTCTVKEYSQQLNLLKLCFPLVHPAMLRRISFRWCETLPNLTDYGYRGGYGSSLIARMDFDGNKERDFLKEHKVITSDNQYYCNVYEAKSAKDVNELMKIMNITK